MANVYLQSIYDTVLAATVRYRTYAPTVFPGYTEEPTSVGPYDAATHKILGIFPTGDVLWRHNGKDLTQFTDSQTLPAPAFNSGWVTPELTLHSFPSFETNSETLKVAATTGAAVSNAVWWIDQEFPDEALTISYTQSIIAGYTPAPPDDWFAGVVFYGDETLLTGYTYTLGLDTAGVVQRVISYGQYTPPSGGLIAILPGSAGINSTDVVIELNTLRSNASGHPPLGDPLIFGKDVQTEVSFAPKGTAFSSYGATFAASWGSSSARRIGLTLTSTVGVVTGPVAFSISNLMVRRRVA